MCGYSPERINPGDKINRLSNIIKVVSGTSIKSTNIIASMYSKIIKAGIHKTPNVKTAEASKVLENTQRSVNISLINEVSVLFNKLNIKTKEVLEVLDNEPIVNLKQLELWAWISRYYMTTKRNRLA